MAFCWLKPDAPAPDKRPLDTISVITGAGGLLLVLFGLNGLSEKTAPWLAAAGLASGMVLMALMLRRCRRHPAPLLRVHLLGEPLMRFSMLVYQCVPGMFIGVNVVGMFWLQTVAGLSPAASGALMVPWSVASFMAISATARLFNRLGPRPLISLGCLLQAGGIVLLTQTDAQSPWALLVTAFFLMKEGEVMNRWFKEVLDAHVAIERWLGRGEGDVQALLDRFSPDYSMIPLNGVPLDMHALNAFFTAAGGSKTGLEIQVDALSVIAEWPDGAVVGYRETQRIAQESTVRWSTVVFELHEGEPRWRHLHETRQA